MILHEKKTWVWVVGRLLEDPFRASEPTPGIGGGRLPVRNASSSKGVAQAPTENGLYQVRI
jgi:hypothetical protein